MKRWERIAIYSVAALAVIYGFWAHSKLSVLRRINRENPWPAYEELQELKQRSRYTTDDTDHLPPISVTAYINSWQKASYQLRLSLSGDATAEQLIPVRVGNIVIQEGSMAMTIDIEVIANRQDILKSSSQGVRKLLTDLCNATNYWRNEHYEPRPCILEIVLWVPGRYPAIAMLYQFIDFEEISPPTITFYSRDGKKASSFDEIDL